MKARHGKDSNVARERTMDDAPNERTLPRPPSTTLRLIVSAYWKSNIHFVFSLLFILPVVKISKSFDLV